jgi:hypothetical protein
MSPCQPPLAITISQFSFPLAVSAEFRSIVYSCFPITLELHLLISSTRTPGGGGGVSSNKRAPKPWDN